MRFFMFALTLGYLAHTPILQQPPIKCAEPELAAIAGRVASCEAAGQDLISCAISEAAKDLIPYLSCVKQMHDAGQHPLGCPYDAPIPPSQKSAHLRQNDEFGWHEAGPPLAYR